MAPEQIDSKKQTVADFLKKCSEHKFIIPEYQREYAWDDEKAEKLFDDIWNFTVATKGKKGKTYFLGTSVLFLNTLETEDINNEIDLDSIDEDDVIATDSLEDDIVECDDTYYEVIDGQQRITSLFLLLRAIYTWLEISEDDLAKTYINRISCLIWKTHEVTSKPNKEQILLESKVVDSKLSSVLHNILKTGHADVNAKDNYSVNYRLFQRLFSEKLLKSATFIYRFITTILDRVIVLPIIADTQDTALTIFSTLNDRGLPLSESDIFKVNIYKKLDKNEKDKFIEQWRNIESNARDLGVNIQQLFYYYMFYLRAKANDTNTTTPGLKKYYSKNNFEQLHKTDLLDNLDSILNFLYAVYRHDKITVEIGYHETETWSLNENIRKILDILNSYPNEFWKYPVITYYLSHKNTEHFETFFLKFLRKLLFELLTKYLYYPTINAVKADILRLNKDCLSSIQPIFEFKNLDISDIHEKIIRPNYKVVRILLKMLAYMEPTQDILPDKWEIEHIFPQKWNESFFPNASKEIIEEKIEHLGNKTLLENKLNIKASNGYFTAKIKEYQQSKIEITKQLSVSEQNDWNLEDIDARDTSISLIIRNLLNTWNSDYSTGTEQVAVPTPEELEMIKKFRERGLI